MALGVSARVTRGILLIAAMAVLVAAPALALEVGDQAPTFIAKDTEGRMIALEDYKGKKHAVLVFYIGYT